MESNEEMFVRYALMMKKYVSQGGTVVLGTPPNVSKEELIEIFDKKLKDGFERMDFQDNNHVILINK